MKLVLWLILEFDSEPDAIISRPKYKRSLKRKERDGDVEKREHRRKLHAAKTGQKIDKLSTEDSEKSEESNEFSIIRIL